VPGLDAACCDAGAVAAVRSELILQRLRERIATPEVVAATVAARRIEWIQLDYRMLAFPDAIEAAEAALCAREDGDPLCAVAAACGRPLLATRAFLDEIDACAHDALLAASDGEVVGPLPLRGEHVVIEVLGKRWPSPDEPATAQRARRLVVARALRRAMDERVTWTDWT
jgi:hypothetical protein